MAGSAASSSVGSVLFTADQIASKVAELGQQMAKDFQHEVPVLLSILKGSVPFVADLMRAVDVPVEVEYLSVSSYEGATKSSGVVRIGQDVGRDVTGRHLVVVEDIVDTGTTMRHLYNYLAALAPASIKTCALLQRAGSGSQENVPMADYVGFVVEDDAFLVGYGLDVDQLYRNLPYIACYNPDGKPLG